jgi:hypothetical protein
MSYSQNAGVSKASIYFCSFEALLGHSDLYKRHALLWKDLKPTSELHREGSLDKLKQRVEAVNFLVKDAMTTASDLREFQWDMEIGHKGIVRVAPPQRPTAKTSERPSLNTEDIDF